VANGWLIASSASSTRRYAVSAGSAQGMSAGMPVRTAQVWSARAGSGPMPRVLLVTDTESTVPVRRATDGTPAFINGRGDGTLQVRLLSLAQPAQGWRCLRHLGRGRALLARHAHGHGGQPDA
jgi:rod shape-determining protein MreC